MQFRRLLVKGAPGWDVSVESDHVRLVEEGTGRTATIHPSRLYARVFVPALGVKKVIPSIELVCGITGDQPEVLHLMKEGTDCTDGVESLRLVASRSAMATVERLRARRESISLTTMRMDALILFFGCFVYGSIAIPPMIFFSLAVALERLGPPAEPAILQMALLMVAGFAGLWGVVRSRKLLHSAWISHRIREVDGGVGMSSDPDAGWGLGAVRLIPMFQVGAAGLALLAFLAALLQQSWPSLPGMWSVLRLVLILLGGAITGVVFAWIGGVLAVWLVTLVTLVPAVFTKCKPVIRRGSTRLTVLLDIPALLLVSPFVSAAFLLSIFAVYSDARVPTVYARTMQVSDRTDDSPSDDSNADANRWPEDMRRN
ncbi:MAG: hypothetical protein GMKNLPBB_03317 [Myxococcota bacterium]|nr:hypothetical protein [Myxococcota bacterium]